jgi:hypothetical protein
MNALLKYSQEIQDLTKCIKKKIQGEILLSNLMFWIEIADFSNTTPQPLSPHMKRGIISETLA